MPESVESRLARIEEVTKSTKSGVTRIEDSMKPLIDKVHKHEIKLALLNRDSKWRTLIIVGVSSVIGAAAELAVAYFRHG